MTKVDQLAADVFSYTTYDPHRAHKIALQSQSVDVVAQLAGWSCWGSGYLGHLTKTTMDQFYLSYGFQSVSALAMPPDLRWSLAAKKRIG